MSLLMKDPAKVGTNVTDNWSTASHASYVSGKGRVGGDAMSLGSGSVTRVIANTTECWENIAFGFSAAPSSDQIIARWFDATAGNTQIDLCLLAGTSQLQFKRGSTAIGSPSAPLTATSTCTYHFQVHVKIDPTSGIAELKFNGAATTLISFTGNTKNTSNAFFNQLALNGPSDSTPFFFCDICAVDGSGTPTGFQGDLLIRKGTLTGDSATSGKNQFTTSPTQTTGNHYLNVSDGSDSSFNADATVGDVERYRFSLASSVPPTWMTTRLRAELSTTGARNVAPGFSSGGVDSVGPDFSVPSSPLWSPDFCLVNDPATSAAWGSNPSAEVLVKITA